MANKDPILTNIEACSLTDENTLNSSSATQNRTDSVDFETYRYTAYNFYYFVLYVILIVPTVLGNSLIIIALIRFRKLRKSTAFIMIGNLAVSDLLVGFVALPLEIVHLVTNIAAKVWYYCLISVSLTYCFMLASVINLLLLSIERFHAIVYPLEHQTRVTKSKVYSAVCLSWICVLLVGLAPLMGWRKSNETMHRHICRKDDVFSKSFKNTLCSVVVGAMITNFVLFVVVMRIALQKLGRFGESGDHEGHRRLRRNVRHTVIMLIISGQFILLWAPFCMVSLIPRPSRNVLLAKDWLASLGLINSCLNWVVFGVRSRQFRQAMASVLTCECTDTAFEINTSSV